MTGKARAAFVEILSVLIILGVAAAIAAPKYADVQRREAAQRIVADIETVRNAVYTFYSDSAYFPAESADEILLPASLVPYLPPGFSDRRSYGTIAYKNWPVRDTVESVPASNVVAAVVVPRDTRIGATAASLVHNTAKFNVGNSFAFIFFGG